MVAVVFLVVLVAAGTTTSDQSTQIGVLVTLLGSVGAIITVVVKLMRDGRRREQGEDSIIEQQRTELLEPIKLELARARLERDVALRQRAAAIDALVAGGLHVPPEVYR